MGQLRAVEGGRSGGDSEPQRSCSSGQDQRASRAFVERGRTSGEVVGLVEYGDKSVVIAYRGRRQEK
jgi:hypothetical protein